VQGIPEWGTAAAPEKKEGRGLGKTEERLKKSIFGAKIPVIAYKPGGNKSIPGQFTQRTAECGGNAEGKELCSLRVINMQEKERIRKTKGGRKGGNMYYPQKGYQ